MMKCIVNHCKQDSVDSHLFGSDVLSLSKYYEETLEESHLCDNRNALFWDVEEYIYSLFHDKVEF